MNDKNDKPVHFSNNFGTIRNEEISIHNYNRTFPLRMQYIRKMLLVKRRKLHHNAFFLVISIFIFWMMEYNNLFLINQGILGFSGIVILLISILHRSFESKFVILMKFDFVKIKVKESLEEDTKNFIIQFNKYRSDLIKDIETIPAIENKTCKVN